MKCLTLFALLIGASQIASAETGPATKLNFYTCKEGDTLRSICEERFNGVENKWELLEYNGYTEENIRPGTVLSIPAEAQARAKQKISDALDALTELRYMNATEYSPQNYKFASRFNRDANIAKDNADYEQAIQRCKRVLYYAKAAKKEIRRKAPSEITAELAHKSKPNVEFKRGESSEWKMLNEGERLFAGDFIRTGKGAKALIVFHDKSRFTMEENSTLLLNRVTYNEEDKQADSELKVLNGEIFSEITPAKNRQKPNYIIRSRNYTVAIRGTDVRYQNNAMSVLEGSVGMRYDGNVVSFKMGKAALISADGLKKIDLLPAPNPLLVDQRIPQRKLKLFWDLVPGATQYDVEIAEAFLVDGPNGANTVESFVKHIHTESIPAQNPNLIQINGMEMETPLLKEGKYFWRVVAYDENNLKGFYSVTHKVEIFTDLGFKIKSTQPLVESYATSRNSLYASAERVANSIESFEYAINGSTFKPCPPEGVSFQKEGKAGKNTVVFRATTIDGKIGDEQSMDVIIDDQPPVVTHKVTKVGQDTFSVEITAKENEKLKSLTVEVDGEERVIDGSSTRFEVPAGAKLNFQATDVAGNASPMHRFVITEPTAE